MAVYQPNPVLEARNQVLIASRFGGDVAAARATLQVVKAKQAIEHAITMGATDAERLSMAELAAQDLIDVRVREAVEAAATAAVTAAPFGEESVTAKVLFDRTLFPVGTTVRSNRSGKVSVVTAALVREGNDCRLIVDEHGAGSYVRLSTLKKTYKVV